jgi:hypothetical protein
MNEIPYPAEASIAQVRDILDHLASHGKTIISILEIGNGVLFSGKSGYCTHYFRQFPARYPVGFAP